MAFVEASAGTRYLTNQNISIWWVPLSGFANYADPSAAEINAGTNITNAVDTSSYSFGTQASTQVTAHSFAQIASAQVRGFAQFGGDITFYYPRVKGDASNLYATAYTLFSKQGTIGYLVVRVDGVEASGSATPAASGDIVSVYKVQVDAIKDVTAGDTPYEYTVTFLPQGNIASNAVVRATNSTTDTVTLSPTTATVAVGGLQKITATVNGRNLTYGGVVWTSSNPSVGTVSDSGVVKRLVATTSFTVTATYPGGGVTSSTATIS